MFSKMFFFFHIKSLKSDAYFTFIVHLSLNNRFSSKIQSYQSNKAVFSFILFLAFKFKC